MTAKYHNEFFVMKDSKPIPAVIRNYTEADFENLIAIQAKCFPPPFPPDLWWNEAQLKNHVAIFPEGALCIEVDGILAGSLTGVRVNFNSDYPAHTWEEMTDNGYIGTHNSTGNTLYIVDIAVRPNYRKLGIGKILMQAMYHVVVELGIDRLLGGGRMPGYHKVSHEKTPEQYVDSVVKGELKDPVLTFLLSCGRKPLAIAANYLDDAESNNFGVLMEWRNPFKMK